MVIAVQSFNHESVLAVFDAIAVVSNWEFNYRLVVTPILQYEGPGCTELMFEAAGDERYVTIAVA